LLTLKAKLLDVSEVALVGEGGLKLIYCPSIVARHGLSKVKANLTPSCWLPGRPC
jgi:hypothetical protein